MILDQTNRRVLEVLENREKATVVAYWQSGKESGVLACLEEVTVDMWEGYVEWVAEVFGHAVRVTIDRFHVMKNFQDQLSKARREIQRQLPAEAAKALKGTRWLWVTNSENLTAEQRTELKTLSQQFPVLGKLRQQREALRRSFEDRRLRTTSGGRLRLQAWIAEARQLDLKAVDGFCQTMENWLDKIANYFVSRSTKGPTEGFNHGLRAILWRAFGMRNFQHFRARVLDLFGSPHTQESP